MSQFSTQFATGTPAIRLLREGYSVTRRRADEWYHVFNLPHANKGDVAMGLLPQPGTSHSVADSAIVVDHQMVEQINPNEQIWWVKYRVPVFGGGPRSGSRTVTYPVTIKIPIYTAIPGVSGFTFYKAGEHEAISTEQVRVITRFPSATEGQVAQASASRVGKITAVDGVVYQYLGYSSRSAAGSPLRVDYQLRQDVEMRELAPGAIPGSDIFIPRKPVLYRYLRVPTALPEIRVVPMESIYGQFNFGELPQ